METIVDMEGIKTEEDTCYKCGKKINFDNIEDLFIVHIESGDRQQELPPELYLECSDCHLDEIFLELKKEGYLKENVRILREEDVSQNF